MNDEMELLPVLESLSGLDRWREESLLLDFVSGDPLDERLTTVRASEASYFDADGVLRFANPNTPRIDYNPSTKAVRGLLVEEARTNLAIYSQHLTLSPWYAGTAVVQRGGLAPDGSLGYKLCVGSSGFAQLSHTITSNVTQAHTISAYFKESDLRFVQLRLRAFPDAQNFVRAILDTRTGAVSLKDNAGTGSGVTADAMSVGNGWWRLHVSGVPAVSGTQVQIVIILLIDSLGNAAGTQNSPATAGIEFWGVQLEAGAFPTSYIPTLPQFQSRASVKTYHDAQGVLRTAALNEPAYDHGYVDGKWVSKGLSVEGAATNQFRQSNNPNTAYWGVTRLVVVPGTTTPAPDGSAAMLVREDTSPGTHAVVQYNAPVIANTQVVASAFVKPAGRHRIELRGGTSSAWVAQPFAQFNLNDGTVTVTAGTGGIQPLGNGWFRVWVSGTMRETAASAGLEIFTLDDSGALSYTGNGTSGIYTWGWQFEVGTTPSSFVQTTTSAVTRAADVAPSAAVTRAADFPSMAVAGWYRADEGTFIAEASTFNTGISSFSRVAEIAESAGKLGMSLQRNGTDARGFSGDGVNLQLSQKFPSGSVRRFAMAMRRNDFALAAGANDLATDNTAEIGSVATDQRLTIGAAFAGNSQLNGHIKRIAYYPRRLFNDEIKRLTTI